MKRQKTLTLMAVIVLVLCAIGLFAIAGCKADETEQHEHTFMRVWSSDEEGHWHKALCEHKDVTTPKEPHVDEDGDEECDVCGYKLPHKHRYSEYYYNETEHWREPICGDTREVADKGRHEWNDGVEETPAGCETEGQMLYTCKVCGATKREPIEPTDHLEYVWVNGRDSNCTETGEYAHYECKACGKKFNSDYQEVDPATLIIPINETGHLYDEGVILEQATCKGEGKTGLIKYTCQYNPEHTYTDIIPIPQHQWDEDTNLCRVCNKERAYKLEKSTFAESNFLYMGEYPQSKLENDDPALSNLTSQYGEKPTKENARGWTNIQHFKTDGSQEAVEDYWYIDVDLDADGRFDYRGLYFTSYINVNSWNGTYPTDTEHAGQKFVEKAFQAENGYTTDNIYWFKYEPIEWRILRNQSSAAVNTRAGHDDQAVIMANIILDIQPFSVDGSAAYATSNLSQFLTNENYGFYKTAFRDAQKEIIVPDTSSYNVRSLSQKDIKSTYCFGVGDKWQFNRGFEAIPAWATYDVGEEEAFKARRQKTLDYIAYLKSLYGEAGWNEEHIKKQPTSSIYICEEFWGAQPRVFKTTDYAKALGAEDFNNIDISNSKVLQGGNTKDTIYSRAHALTKEQAQEIYYGNCSWWCQSGIVTPTGEYNSADLDLSQNYGVLPSMYIKIS